MDQPPETPRADRGYELHGQAIEDPYLWLEESTPEVDRWVDEQNAHAEAYLDAVPVREALEPRFEAYARTTEYGSIVPRPSGYFQALERPAHEHAVLTYRSELDAEREVLADPNDWSEDGTTSMGWWSASPAGDLVAYAVDEDGEEQYDVTVVEVADGTVLDDLVDLGRSMQPAWAPTGLYYTETGSAEAGRQHEKRVRFHRFGSAQESDPILREVDDPAIWPAPVTDRGGEHLIVIDSIAWERSELRYAPVGDDDLTPLLVDTDHMFHPLFGDDRLYLRTNHDADRYRLAALGYDRLPGPVEPDDLEAVVPAGEGIFTTGTIAGDALVIHRQVDVVSQLEVYGPDGTARGSIDLPGMGTVTGLSGNREAAELFFGYESFDHPPTVFRYDTAAEALAVRDQVDIDHDIDLTVEQQWVTSQDGTRVPMFVVHRADLDPDGGPHPALLYGYGGYEISLTPVFPTFAMEFLRAGGVYARANLRGGGEFGKRWHEAARFERKQRTFDDMIAAAEHLVDAGYTTPDDLAIRGGSNGGLTVGAVLTQRPELVDAVVCEVPLLDMLRFHRFLLGDSWTTEYGSPEDPEAFEYIAEYSPYHHVVDRSYPAAFLKTAEGDTRVHPVHAWKMAARLQAHQTADRPILCKTDRETGHGTGKPTWMVVEEALDVWSFLFEELDVVYDGVGAGSVGDGL